MHLLKPIIKAWTLTAIWCRPFTIRLWLLMQRILLHSKGHRLRVPSLIIIRSSTLHLLRYVDLEFLSYTTVYLLRASISSKRQDGPKGNCRRGTGCTGTGIHGTGFHNTAFYITALYSVEGSTVEGSVTVRVLLLRILVATAAQKSTGSGPESRAGIMRVGDRYSITSDAPDKYHSFSK